MGWLDWLRETAGRVTEVVETGLRGIIELPSEIRAYISRPATPEQIEEVISQLVSTERFIREAIPDEAQRLAFGVPDYEPLVNVARVREWTAQNVRDIEVGPNKQISVRAVLVGPDGTMTHVDVAFPTGERFTDDEFLRRAASALDDKFVSQYDLKRSELIRRYLVAMEPYIQTFVPLGKKL